MPTILTDRSLDPWGLMEVKKGKMLKLLTLGDGVACGPKIDNHRFSILLLSL